MKQANRIPSFDLGFNIHHQITGPPFIEILDLLLTQGFGGEEEAKTTVYKYKSRRRRRSN